MIPRFTTYLHMSQSDLNQELWDACYKGDLEQLKYVLHGPDLGIHADLYYDSGECFFWAYSERHMDLVNYLLYDEKYEYHDKLKKMCDLAFAPHPIGVPNFTRTSRKAPSLDLGYQASKPLGLL